MNRLQLLAALVALVWAGGLARTAALQVNGDGLQVAATRQRIRSETLPPQPGRIVDRHGRILAASERRPSLFANPSRIKNIRTWSAAVGPIIGLEADSLADRLRTRSRREFYWLRRRADDKTVRALEESGVAPSTWGARQEWVRRYPQGRDAAHLIGFRDIDHQPRFGAEKTVEAELAGVPGRQSVLSDARGRPLKLLEQVTTPVEHGRTVRLTVDAVVQRAVARALDDLHAQWAPRWSAALVVDVASSTLLAAETRPTFDPNAPADAVTAGRHHAFSTSIEPGSTLKPFVVAATLDAGRVRRDDMIDCGNGAARFGERVLHDASSHGTLSVEDVLVKSSNIGMARIAAALGPERLYEVLTDCGFGRPVIHDLGRSPAGLLRPTAEWSGYSMTSLPMGHELTTTPLQLAAAYAALARGGRRSAVSMVFSDTPVRPPAQMIATPENAGWLVSGPLRQVVLRGTGRRAHVDGADVWGKTGTSQKFDRDAGRYRSDRLTCVFCGGAPTTAPRIVVVVVADEPTLGTRHGGGTVAAPTGGRIIADTLRVLGELPPEGSSAGDQLAATSGL